MKPPETCENCNRVIGNLETPRVHQGHIVCATCAKVLDDESAAPGVGRPNNEGAVLEGIGALLGIGGVLVLFAPLVLPPAIMDQMSEAAIRRGMGACILAAIIGLVTFAAGRFLRSRPG